MVRRPHAHAVLVEHLGDVVGVDAVEQERDGAATPIDVAGAVDVQPVLEALLERPERVLGELLLVGADGVHAERREVVDGGGEPAGLDERHGPGLELPRHLVGLEAVEAHVGDHLAATEERRHRVEQLGAGPQATETGRAEHLVAGEADEVGVPRLHVDRQMGDGLGGVHVHERTGGVGGV